MAIQRTLAIIKPDAYQAGNVGNIISMIEENGFKIIHLILFKFTPKSAGQFYKVHEGKPFFDGLIEFITSDKVIAMVLEKNNAVKELRNLMGATNPKDAAPDTIRGKYAKSMPDNAIHGSDSPSNARKEITYIFGEFASIPSTEKSLAKEY
jgi:nucleoside-diphosphate kinase